MVPRSSRSSAPRWSALLGALALVGAVGGGLAYKVQHDRAQSRLQDNAITVVTDFLRAWSAGDAPAAAAQVQPEQAALVTALLPATRSALHAVSASYALRGAVSADRQPGASYTATVVVAGLGRAQWTGRVPLVRVGQGWRVAFTPAVLHPALRPGGRFAYLRTPASRGRLLTADGHSLSVDADLSGNLRGVVVTATAGSTLPPETVPGDDVGTTGLERAWNASLAGQAGGSVTVLDAAGHQVAVVLSSAKADGSDLSTTLNLKVQRAGEAALAGVPQAGALVAIDTTTGQVLASVNHPAGGFGRALAGKGPPGSTFKIITSAAALIAGVPEDTTLDCSATATAYGRSFKNAENQASGPITWRQAFASSCNTWFVRLQDKVPLAVLDSTAALFGFSTAPRQQAAAGVLPVASFGGSAPMPQDRAQAAGQAIGQDLVLASPLQMASVAAAVADGSWREPVLAGAATVVHPLPPAILGALRSFMAAAVGPGGTAEKAGLPAGTYGKTGTAETAASAVDPQRTDSWFIGYRGTVAFAVEFDQAGFGAQVAAPAAARFLAALG